MVLPRAQALLRPIQPACTMNAQRMSAWSVSITSDWSHSHNGATVTAFLVLVNLWSLGQPVNDGGQSQIYTFLKGGKDSSCTCPSGCISCFSSWPGALQICSGAGQQTLTVTQCCRNERTVLTSHVAHYLPRKAQGKTSAGCHYCPEVWNEQQARLGFTQMR